MTTSINKALEDRIEMNLLTKEYSVLDLFSELSNEGYSDADIKETMSHMLHDNQIELTPDRTLRSLAVTA